MALEARELFSQPESEYIFDIPITAKELEEEILADEGLSESWQELRKKTKYLHEEDRDRLKQAVLSSFYFHDKLPKQEKNRFRNDGSHFVTHTIGATSIIAEEKLEIDMLVAELFHDTVEDTEIDRAWIEQYFGSRVLSRVDGMTNISSKRSKDQNEAESLKKKYDALRFDKGEDPGIIIGKLADRIHNMRTINHEGMKPESKRRNSIETLEVYVPLARRTGMLKWKEELESLSYSVLFPGQEEEATALYAKRLEKVTAERDAIVDFYTRLCGESITTVISNPSIAGCFREIVNPKGPLNPPIHTISIIYPDTENFTNIAKPLETQRKLFGGAFEFREQNRYGIYRIGDTEIEVKPTENHKRYQTSIADLFRYDLDQDSQEMDQIRNRLYVKMQPELELINRYENKNDRRITDIELVQYLKEDLRSRFLITVYTPNGQERRVPLGSTGLDFATSVHEEFMFSAEKIKINNSEQALPVDTVLQAGNKIRVEHLPEKKWDISPKKLAQVTTARSFALLREWAKYMEQINKVVETADPSLVLTNLKKENLYDTYVRLEEHGYDLDKIQKEVINFRLQSPEIGKHYLQEQFKYWMSHEPSFNIRNAWNFVGRRWKDLYPDIDSFLKECAFQNVKTEHVYEFLEAAKQYEDTLILFPHILAPDETGRLTKIDDIMSTNGFGIVNVYITQNIRGNLAGIQYRLEPSRSMDTESLKQRIIAEGYLLEE